jgi:hypothetical protein
MITTEKIAELLGAIVGKYIQGFVWGLGFGTAFYLWGFRP